MKNRVLLAALVGAPAALLISPACAGQTFEIDGGHTHVMFKFERFGLSYVIGGFTDVAGELTLDKDAPENSSVNATVQIASFSSGNPNRDAHAVGPRWLNAEQSPAMTFTSTSVELTGEETAIVTGDLTLHGVTRPLSLDVALHNFGNDPSTKREAAGFSATGSLNRQDFGITTAQGFISDEVEITIEVLAIAAEE
ncbi:MAG: YceI family protein [Parvularculaceae bacterium]